MSRGRLSYTTSWDRISQEKISYLTGIGSILNEDRNRYLADRFFDKADKNFDESQSVFARHFAMPAAASRQYQTELVKQISLQLEAAKAASAQADAEFDSLLSKRQALREMGVEFSPLEYPLPPRSKLLKL